MELWKALGLDMAQQRLVTLVGGGGKTTCMYALAHEARQAGKTVIVTTTTHIVPHPALFLTDETEDGRLGELVAEYGIVTVGKLNSKEKMVGADNLPACKKAADVVLAEGDGARIHPLKAPADHEPVIPPSADAVIAIAGMDALGQPIGTICHRPERVCALLGQEMDHRITPEDVAEILASAHGGRKNVPNGIPFCCILNKAESEGRKNQAERIAALLEREGIPTVMTSFTEEEGRHMLVLIKGAGDLATGTAIRLHRAGMAVVMTDIAQPTAVRRTVAFCQCIYDGTATVEDITALHCRSVAQVRAALAEGKIPVLVDPGADIRTQMPFDGVVDAILAKKNLGTKITDAPVVLALGPGFTAGVDCHGVVETMRGHDLGRLLTSGCAIPNTGVPGDIGGYSAQRIIRASADGAFCPIAHIGQTVAEGETVATVAGVPVLAQMSGMVRGMLPQGLPVTKGMKSGDIDPRCQARHCHTVSDKARAIGGGVLEGLLRFAAMQP